MEFSGMDLTAVQKAASDLKTQGNKTSVLRDEIDKLIKSMEDLWVGADAKDFVYSRWPKESRKMTTLGEKLLGLADKLTRQINDQVATSSATSLDGGNESWFFGMRNAPDYGENDKGEAYKAEAVPPETPIDASAITLESVNQGSFGDCYFLAALAGLAESDPEFLANNMQLNPDGTYTVRFYRANPETGNIEPVDITIDPVVSSGGAGDASGNPNWVSIYEAAYAKYLDGSQVDYDDLDGPLNLGGLPRTPYLALTGANPEVGYPGIDGLTEMLKNGPVTVGTPLLEGFVDDPAIVPRHMYTITETGVNENGEPTITVRNPWGHDSSSEPYKEYVTMTEAEFKESFIESFMATTGDRDKWGETLHD